ncbi:MAG: plasmid replication protein RepC, partial [Rubrimonas sp.]
LRRLREAAGLRLRDAAKLAAWAGGDAALEAEMAEAARALRRRLGPDDLAALHARCDSLLSRAKALVVTGNPDEMGGSDAQNGRHQQNSNPESSESEPCHEGQGRDAPALPLGLVLKAAPDILPYAPHGIRSWRDLIATAETLRPCLGISPDGWAEAQRVMGPAVAAVVLAAILQRADRIDRPGGYLRALTARAADGGFSPGPMVMALLRSEGRCAA